MIRPHLRLLGLLILLDADVALQVQSLGCRYGYIHASSPVDRQAFCRNHQRSTDLNSPSFTCLGASTGQKSINAVDDDDDDDHHQAAKAAAVAVCWNPQLRRVMGSIATVGILETAYLTWSKLLQDGDTTTILCMDGSDCSMVLNGPYSYIPGTEIPLAIAGFVAYSTVAVLALGPLFISPTSELSENNNRIWLTAVSTFMGIFSVFLMTLLFGVLKQSCAFCIASATCSILLANLCWLGGAIPKERAKEGIVVSIGGGFVSLVAAVILFVTVDSSSSVRSRTNFEAQAAGNKDQINVVLADSGKAPPPITTMSSSRALDLANDLQSLNTRFYGAYWCSHCYDQKEAMGREAMTKIPYIECSRDGLNSQSGMCREREIPGYPTWEINGKLFPGEKDLQELEDLVRSIKN